MNLTLVESWSEGINRLCKKRLPKLVLQRGDQIRVGAIHGPMGMATVIDVTESHYLLEGHLDTPAPEKLNITLCLAYSRPKMFRRALSSATEIGCKDIRIFRSYLCEKSYEKSKAFEENALNELVQQALEQSCDTIPPVIQQFNAFKPLVEDSLLRDFPPKQIVVADPEGETFRELNDSIQCLLIGPEAGFSEMEIKLCQELGIQVCSFSKRQLRYESAVPYILGRIGPPALG